MRTFRLILATFVSVLGVLMLCTRIGLSAYVPYTAGTGISITAGVSGDAIANTGVTALAGTANQVSVTGSTGSITIALSGPYTPSTFTSHGLLYGAGTSSIAALAELSNGQLAIGSTGNPPTAAVPTGSGITVGAGAGSLSFTATGGLLSAGTVASGSCPYTVASSDVALLVSAGSGANCAVNLPAAAGSFRVIPICKMDSNAKTIANTPNGTDTIDGTNAADSIAVQYECITYLDYASGKWKKL